MPKQPSNPFRQRSPSPGDSPTPCAPGLAFPVVGVEASAGGLEAFTQLLQHLPADTGMAFVLIQHLHPEHGSALTEILAGVLGLQAIKGMGGITFVQVLSGRRLVGLKGQPMIALQITEIRAK